MNTAPVPGQTPHDESDRRTEPRSSVSDLVNSLTSEMLMVRSAGRRGPRQELDWEAGGREGTCVTIGDSVGVVHPGRATSTVTEGARLGFFSQLFPQNRLSVPQFPHLSSETKNARLPPVSFWVEGGSKQPYSWEVFLGL